MPNGNLGNGAGTQASPFEVWDIEDLNALRGIPTSAANRVFIRFKADIDFRNTRHERHFPTIRFGNDTATANSWDFIDIDGEGHEIRNFRQIGDNADACGFFRAIDCTLRNLSFVNVDIVTTGSSITRGVVAVNMRSALVENVAVTGSLFSMASSTNGFISSAVPLNATTPFILRNCRIELAARCNGSFSGFFFSSSNIVEFHNCLSACTVLANATGNLGGFVGNTSGQNLFFSCISACRFIMITAAQQFSLVAGFRATANSIVYMMRNCISMCRFEGIPPATANNISAFAPAHLTAANAVECYSICQYDLRGSTANIRGGDGVIIFDWQNTGLPLNRFNDGTAVGVTTEQLQSRAFLESRGWVFAA